MIEQIEQQQNLHLTIVILGTAFFAFALFNIIYTMTSVLFVSEASMVTITIFLSTAITVNFPIMSADTLNLLNASAMEAIVGILMVIHATFGWLSRPNNLIAGYLEAFLGYLSNELGILEKKYGFKVTRLRLWLNITAEKIEKWRQKIYIVNCLSLIIFLENSIKYYSNFNYWKIKFNQNITIITIFIILSITVLLIKILLPLESILYQNILEFGHTLIVYSTTFTNTVIGTSSRYIIPRSKYGVNEILLLKTAKFEKINIKNTSISKFLNYELTNTFWKNNIKFSYNYLSNLEKINILTTCRLNSENWESIPNRFNRNPKALLRNLDNFEQILAKPGFFNKNQNKVLDKTIYGQNTKMQSNINFQIKNLTSRYFKNSLDFEIWNRLLDSFRDSNITFENSRKPNKQPLGILPIIAKLESVAGSNSTTTLGDLITLGRSLPDFITPNNYTEKTIVQKQSKFLNKNKFEQRYGIHKVWYKKPNYRNFIPKQEIKNITIPLYLNSYGSTDFRYAEDMFSRYLQNNWSFKKNITTEFSKIYNLILEISIKIKPYFSENLRPHKFRIKHPLNAIEQPIVLRSKIKATVLLKEHADFFSWSTKNYGALFSYYSKLLPWWESSDEESEVLDSTEKPLFTNMVSLSEIEKLQDISKLSIKNQIAYKKENWIIPETVNSLDTPTEGILYNYTSSINNLLKFENNLKDFGIIIAETDLLRTVNLKREQQALDFPSNSPRGLNIWGLDSVNFIRGPVYNRGSSRLGLREYNLDPQLEVPILSQTIQKNIKYNLNTKVVNRVFSFSTNIVANMDKNNYNIVGKQTISQKKTNIIGNLDSDNLSIIDFRSKRKKFWTKPGKSKLKLFIDGNFEKKNLKIGKRSVDILNNKKKVQDRMLLPLKNMLFSRKQDIGTKINNNFTISPLGGAIPKFIQKNDKLLEAPKIINLWKALNKIDLDYSLGMDQKNITEILIVEEDSELDSEAIRTTTQKPHSLYGVLWDEYLKQTFNVNLQFLKFDLSFSNRYVNNLEDSSSIGGLNFKKTIEKALQPDFRYKFTINDEIKNTILGKLLPKAGYIRELNKPNYQLLNLSSTGNITILEEVKEQIKILKKRKKKLKKYIKRKKKFGENPASFKYDLLPQALKLPYRKKSIWVKNMPEYFKNNLGVVEYGIFQKKNQKMIIHGRLDNTISFTKRKKNTIKYWNPGNYTTASPLILNTDNTSINMGYYGGDLFGVGTEYSSKILLDQKHLGIEMFRTRRPNTLFGGRNSLNYLLGQTNSKNWIKPNKLRLKRKRNLRVFNRKYILENNIFHSLGTLKYTNTLNMATSSKGVKTYKMREFREFDNYHDFDNPLVNMIRSGDLASEILNLSEKETRLRTFSYLKVPQLKNSIFENSINFYKKPMIGSSMLAQSLIQPLGQYSLENTVYNTSFLGERGWQSIKKIGILDYLNSGNTEILSDGWAHYSTSKDFENYESVGLGDFSSIQMAIAINKLKLDMQIGKQDITRNPYTYFDKNPWIVTTIKNQKSIILRNFWNKPNNGIRISHYPQKLLNILAKMTINFNELILEFFWIKQTVEQFELKSYILFTKNIIKFINNIYMVNYNILHIYLWVLFIIF